MKLETYRCDRCKKNFSPEQYTSKYFFLSLNEIGFSGSHQLHERARRLKGDLCAPCSVSLLYWWENAEP